MYAMFFQDLVGFKFHTMLSPLASRLSPLASRLSPYVLVYSCP